MTCERCNFSSDYLTRIYKDGDDPIFLGIEGKSFRQHLPTEFCGFCMIGEHVPTFRRSSKRWEIGEIISFYESVLPYQFLVKFGFYGDDTEWVSVASDPFAAYAYECRIQDKENDEDDQDTAQSTHQKNATSSSKHKSMNRKDFESSYSIKYRDEHSAVMDRERRKIQCSDVLDGSNFGENGLKSRRLWTEEEDTLLLNTVSLCSDLVDWEQVASVLPNTTALQCRHRYAIKLKEWTPIEDSVLFHAYYFTSGPKWVYITKHLHGRTETSVKNRFHHIKRRLEKVTAKLDVNGYEGDQELKRRIVELATKLEVPWDLTMTVVDLLVHSMKEEMPLMSMNYDFTFALTDLSLSPVGCSRCNLLTPSIQTGDKICKKTGWCQACTETPAYLFGDMLRIYHSIRYSFKKEKLIT